MKSNGQAEQVDVAHVDAAQPVLAAGPVHRLVEQVIDALRQRHRHHGEVDAAGADGEAADQRRHGERTEHAGYDRGIPRQAEMDDGDAADIGAGAEQRRVPERQQPEITEQQIEAEGIEAVDQDVHRQRRERHHQREHQHEAARKQDAVAPRQIEPASRGGAGRRHDPGDLAHVSSSVRRGRRNPAAGSGARSPSARRSRPWPFPARTARSC